MGLDPCAANRWESGTQRGQLVWLYVIIYIPLAMTVPTISRVLQRETALALERSIGKEWEEGAESGAKSSASKCQSRGLSTGFPGL